MMYKVKLKNEEILDIEASKYVISEGFVSFYNGPKADNTLVISVSYDQIMYVKRND